MNAPISPAALPAPLALALLLLLPHAAAPPPASAAPPPASAATPPASAAPPPASAAPPPASGAPSPTSATPLARAACSPRAQRLRELVERALRYAGLERGATRSRRVRLGWAALLPRVTARWSRANGRTADLDVSEPDGGRWYAADRWEVRATWDLSRLVFDGRELRVAAAARARARARRALVDRVSALFVERERLRATRPHTAEMQRAASIALARTNALLDLLTGASRHPTRHE